VARPPRTGADSPAAGDTRPSLPPLEGDGLPTLPTGEPVLHRWFVLAMIPLVVATLAVGVWAVLSIQRDPIPAAERRPPGGPTVTIERGDAELGTTRDVEPGPACAQAIRLVGDSGAIATGRRALAGACALLDSGDYPEAQEGLRAWVRAGGILRIGAFELTGVESSTRVEDDRLVMELNAKFQFEDATRAAPAVLHQLVLLADPDFPGATITAERELLGAETQAAACAALRFPEAPPRGCLDVEELLAEPDPLAALEAAGYPRETAG
jgi:acyl dehydratase